MGNGTIGVINGASRQESFIQESKLTYERDLVLAYCKEKLNGSIHM